jgi:FkbM family methyltransferase
MPIETLSKIVHDRVQVDLPDMKRLLPLPNDLVFVIDRRDNVESYYELASGLGHEPWMIKKILDFTRSGEIYVEVGANYGDFSLQVSNKIGSKGQIYAFEPGANLVKCFKMSMSFNDISNIILENLVVSDQEKEVSFFEDVHGSLGSRVTTSNAHHNQQILSTTLNSYFKAKESTVNVIRLDAEGNECQVLRGATNILDSSPDLRIFIEWQKPLLSNYESIDSMKSCLSNLLDKGFIFLDILAYNDNCNYRNYQLSMNDIFNSDMLEFLAIKKDTLQSFLKIHNNDKLTEECLPRVNNLLGKAVLNTDIDAAKDALVKGAEINYLHTLGTVKATALYLAVENSFNEMVGALLDAKADPNIPTTGGTFPLCMSVQNNDYATTKRLLDSGGDTEVVNDNGIMPLILTAHFGYTNITTLLLDSGADMRATWNGKTSFQMAIGNKHYDTAKLVMYDQEAQCQQVYGTYAQGEFVDICGTMEGWIES